MEQKPELTTGKDKTVNCSREIHQSAEEWLFLLVLICLIAPLSKILVKKQIELEKTAAAVAVDDSNPLKLIYKKKYKYWREKYKQLKWIT